MGIDTRVQTASRVLLDQLCAAVESRLQPLRRVDLPAICDDIGLPTAPDNENLTKRQYIHSRLAKIAEGDQARDVAINFANRYPLGTYGNDATFFIEEMLWQSREPEVSLRVRRGLAAELDDVELFTYAAGFLEVLGRLFVLDPDGLMLWNERRSIIWKIRQHVIRNPEDWSVTQLFQEIGAFKCTSERFRRLIAALAGSEARPDEESQRSFVAAVNSTLAADGFELAEIGEVDGYPDFSFVKLGDPTRDPRPQNRPGASRVSRDDTGDTGRGPQGDDGLRPQLASRHRLDDTGRGDLRPQRTRGDTAGKPHSDNRPAGRAPRADRPRRPRAGQQPQDVSGIPRRPRNGRETPPGRRPRGPRGTALDRSATRPDGRDETDRRR